MTRSKAYKALVVYRVLTKDKHGDYAQYEDSSVLGCDGELVTEHTIGKWRLELNLLVKERNTNIVACEFTILGFYKLD